MWVFCNSMALTCFTHLWSFLKKEKRTKVYKIIIKKEEKETNPSRWENLGNFLFLSTLIVPFL